MVSCSDSTSTDNATETDSVKNTETTTEEAKIEEKAAETETNTEGMIPASEMIDYLITPEYGWKKADEDYSLSFFPDGRLSIQKGEGEEGMSEGKWALNNTEVLLTYEDGTSESLPVKGDGTFLFIDEAKYEVYTINNEQ